MSVIIAYLAVFSNIDRFIIICHETSTERRAPMGKWLGMVFVMVLSAAVIVLIAASS